MALTDVAAKNAKAKADPYKLSDGGGLFLHVMPSGAKVWRLAYRNAGKQRTLTIGPYPAIKIAEARSKREEAKEGLVNGVDPSVKKQMEKVKGQTFADVAEDYLQHLSKRGRAESTIKQYRLYLKHIDFGDMALSDIKPMDVLLRLQKLERAGKLYYARILRALASSIFQYGIPRLLIDNDPASVLVGSTQEPTITPRAAITDVERAREVYHALADRTGANRRSSVSVTEGMAFQILTASRPGEAANARWEEFDLEAGVWTVPEERMKMRREHPVPLSAQALAIVRRMRDLGIKSPYVFPGRDRANPVSHGAFSMAAKRAGLSAEEFVPHGWRATFSTIMNEQGHDPLIIELCLAHKVLGRVQSIYDRSTRLPERLKVLQAWADLITGRQVDK